MASLTTSIIISVLAFIIVSCNAYSINVKSRPAVGVLTQRDALISHQSSTALYAGFGKPKEVVEQTSRVPKKGTVPCACGSGKQYDQCCQPFHTNAVEPSNPVQVIRARFSALNYGIVQFLTKTTHPDNRDYVSEEDDYVQIGSKKTKRTIWEKELKAFSSGFDFNNLVFINEERDSNPAPDANEAFVEIALERKAASAFKYDFIEEKQRFRKNPKSGVWNVVSSDMKIKKANEKMVSPDSIKS